MDRSLRLKAESSKFSSDPQSPPYLTFFDVLSFVHPLTAATDAEKNFDESPRIDLKRNDGHALLVGCRL